MKKSYNVQENKESLCEEIHKQWCEFDGLRSFRTKPILEGSFYLKLIMMNS